ncbi:hypothetical protein H0H87_002091 [Tephrocybe sp. NHM501043]|nr:hypothetical protein H0H87_002091 [Tephrocybe sp. NHM501043]
MRDLNLSSRVRRLRVNPIWFNLKATVPKPPLQSIYSKIVARTLSISFNPRRKNDVAIQNGSQLKTRAYIDELTTDLVVQFSNVTSFVLVTRYLPHPASLPQFLLNGWQSFGPNLRRLTINGPLAGFATLLPDPADLVSLEDLTIRFSTDLMSEDPSADTQTLSGVILPFLRQITPQLRNFNLMSSALGDHSMIFHALDHMPHLTTLSLNIGFYPPLLNDSSGLTKFLSRNAQNLQHVKLQPLETFRSPPNSGHAHDHFSGWMSANIFDEGFLSNLQTLVVLPSTDMSAMARLDACSLYILRSKDTLTALILGERCLSFVELAALVASFEHRTPDDGLKTLHVKLISLNPEVFDLLAAKLEGLDDLDIKFNALLDDVQYENPLPIEDEEPTAEMEALFAVDMATVLHDDKNRARDSVRVATVDTIGSSDFTNGPYSSSPFPLQLIAL